MYLKDIFEQLTQGELSGLSLGGYEGDEIIPKDYVRVIPHINMAITEVLKRFNLNTKVCYIEQHSNISTYQLHVNYARTNDDSGELVKYIVNSEASPFTGHVQKIEEIFECSPSECATTEYEKSILVPKAASRHNDRNELHSYWVNTPTSIQVKCPVQGKLLAVTYRAVFPPLVAHTEADLYQEIDLPVSYLQAIVYYAAARATSALPPVDGLKQSTLFLQLFEQEIAQLTRQGLDINDNTSETKFEENGWI